MKHLGTKPKTKNSYSIIAKFLVVEKLNIWILKLLYEAIFSNPRTVRSILCLAKIVVGL